jgi:hypothetical protein
MSSLRLDDALRTKSLRDPRQTLDSWRPPRSDSSGRASRSRTSPKKLGKGYYAVRRRLARARKQGRL